MARTPKALSTAAPARRGRRPKAAEPIERAAATDEAEGEAATVRPARGKPGPKPRQRPEAAMPALPKEGEEQAAMDLDQPGAAMRRASQDDAPIAEVARPASADGGGAAVSHDTGADDAPAKPSRDGSEPARPAARWDRAADTVRFDWPEIERTASRDGPDQAMAKLLVAARAEGANSRWPL